MAAAFMHAGASTRAVGIMAAAVMRAEAFTPVVRAAAFMPAEVFMRVAHAAASMGAELFTVAGDSSKNVGRAWPAIKCATSA